jgi:hypothetical protein
MSSQETSTRLSETATAVGFDGAFGGGGGVSVVAHAAVENSEYRVVRPVVLKARIL